MLCTWYTEQTSQRSITLKTRSYLPYIDSILLLLSHERSSGIAQVSFRYRPDVKKPK